ncbi:hypothetical protein B0J17DRAFT_723301 [Rhizoctonia solani]|nr:hypothetical protein B0J17DRAFT_723301 [Rhizoctonia solani]
MIKQLGVDDVINQKERPDWAREVKRLTDGQGVDQVVDIAEKVTLVEPLKLIKPRGVVDRLNMAKGESIEDFVQLLLMMEGNWSNSGWK